MRTARTLIPALLATSLLAACSSSDTTAPATSDPATSAPTTTVAAGDDHSDGHDHSHGNGSGTQATVDGFTLAVETVTVPAAGTAEFAFTITDDSGAPVTEFDTHHDKKMHLVMYSHDLATYQHLHPEMDDSGRWSTIAEFAQDGFWHVVTDFKSAGKGIILGSDIKVGSAGMKMASFDTDDRTSTSGSYTAVLSGDTAHEASSPIKVTFTKDGIPVEKVNPYLGANAHLVAVLQDDLSYVHMHPNDGFPGGVMTFTAPPMGHGFYKYFLQADFDGELRLFEFVVYGK